MFEPERNQFSLADGATTSLSEVLSAFSYALDLTEGQPAGHSMRACWIGTAVARAMGISGGALRGVYYAILLKDLGCSSNAARVAHLFAGDDRHLKHEFKLIGPDATDFGAFMVAEVGAATSTTVREQALSNLSENAPAIMTEIIGTRCTRGADIARQLRFSNDVATAIAHLDEHWDGSGLPLGLAGEAIHLGGRIALLAQIADVFYTAHGPDRAIAEVERRAGSWLDPSIAAIFAEIGRRPGFWENLSACDFEQRLAALEPPAHRIAVDEDYLDDIAWAFGAVIDAKSPYTGGHSERVGGYADGVAERVGLDPDQRRALKRAAALHDIGKLGVSSRILEKPGRLEAEEWATMQRHASLTTDILGRIAGMRALAMIAGSHHERLDGAGYPFGLDANSIALETRIITVADFFDALTADRPYREAMQVGQAMDIIGQEVGKAVDERCFAALSAVIDAG